MKCLVRNIPKFKMNEKENLKAIQRVVTEFSKVKKQAEALEEEITQVETELNIHI